MTRLIDADRLKAHVKMQTDLLRSFSSISELGELATVMADGFEREVDIQSTVDAVPIKWLYEQSDNTDRSDRFRNACDLVALTWLEEREKE